VNVASNGLDSVGRRRRVRLSGAEQNPFARLWRFQQLPQSMRRRSRDGHVSALLRAAECARITTGRDITQGTCTCPAAIPCSFRLRWENGSALNQSSRRRRLAEL